MNIGKILFLFILTIFLTACQKVIPKNESLKNQIEQLISDKKSTVGVAIIGPHQDTLSINGDKHFPLQSVYKFHIALAMLHQIEEGKFSLDQRIKIGKEDIMPDLHSPIREKFPEGTTLPLSEIIKYTVAQSDNVGCDLLLKMMGGPEVVSRYFQKNNFKDISIKTTEKVQQANWEMQFLNWTTPTAANEVLQRYYHNDPALLNPANHNYIWNVMKETTTGEDQIKGQMPENIVVAHKTGYSGANEKGITEAVNNIGIVFLPDAQYYIISIFITNSSEDLETNKKIISDISKVTFDYFSKRQ